MEYAQLLIDFIVHIDQYLMRFVQVYGPWIYVILFAIVFTETGVVVMPFLPGDSLLFIVGAMCGVGLLSYPLAVATLISAAFLGDQTNYTVGRHIGPKVFQWEDSRFFNKAALHKTQAYYERYGGITLIMARFMPFVRTFAPFVAGIGQMQRMKYIGYCILAACIWVFGIVTAGYFFGNIPWVKANLEKIIWALIIVPGLLAVYGAWKAGREQKTAYALAFGTRPIT